MKKWLSCYLLIFSIATSSLAFNPFTFVDAHQKPILIAASVLAGIGTLMTSIAVWQDYLVISKDTSTNYLTVGAVTSAISGIALIAMSISGATEKFQAASVLGTITLILTHTQLITNSISYGAMLGKGPDLERHMMASIGTSIATLSTSALALVLYNLLQFSPSYTRALRDTNPN